MCEGVKLTTLDQFDSDEDKRAILYILRSVYNSFVQLVLPLVLRERPFLMLALRVDNHFALMYKYIKTQP